jgi:hypothetical protein
MISATGQKRRSWLYNKVDRDMLRLAYLGVFTRFRVSMWQSPSLFHTKPELTRVKYLMQTMGIGGCCCRLSHCNAVSMKSPRHGYHGN